MHKNILGGSRPLAWCGVALLATLLTACGGGGGRDPILGGGGNPALAPTVISVTPADQTAGVLTATPGISATFSEAVGPITGNASFVVTCNAPCVSPAGSTVTLDSTNKIATYNLANGTSLAPLTKYTATVSGASSIATGLKMAAPYVWSFTTGGPKVDATLPRVTLTSPVTSPMQTNVPTNAVISAAFSKDMLASTLTNSSFSLSCAAPCSNPAGNVNYDAASRSATFRPTAVLAAATTYTVTITTAVTDTAGNPLAGNQAALPAPSNYVWSFTTGAGPAPAGAITISGINPSVNATGVCPSATVSATFSLPAGQRIDPATVNATTFTLRDATATPVTASSIALDATGTIATFTPAVMLVPNVTYSGTIKGGAAGVKDLSNPADQLAADFPFSFTTGPATGSCLQPVALGLASKFGTFGGSAGMTNSGTFTVINGDIGTTAVSTAVTGFHDAGPGCTYTETPLNVGFVNGNIYTAAPPPTPVCNSEGTATTFSIASQASLDARNAYNTLVALPPGSDQGAGSLANLVLNAGVYTAAGGTFSIIGGPLTLDAQGNPNAVFVFQMAKSLTIGAPGFPQDVRLINGAQAKNVFWQVGSAATINPGGGGTVNGSIISQTGVVFSTAGSMIPVTLNGRALSLGASVTMVNTVINVPQ